MEHLGIGPKVQYICCLKNSSTCTTKFYIYLQILFSLFFNRIIHLNLIFKLHVFPWGFPITKQIIPVLHLNGPKSNKLVMWVKVYKTQITVEKTFNGQAFRVLIHLIILDCFRI